MITYLYYKLETVKISFYARAIMTQKHNSILGNKGETHTITTIVIVLMPYRRDF